MPKQEKDKLTKAYHRMLKRIQETFEHIDDKTLPKVQKALEDAKKTAVELGEITHEEAEKIGEYLKRDMHAAASFMHQTKKSIADWLLFDKILVEDKFLEMFSLVADKTWVEFMEFTREVKHGPEYHSDEVIGIGSLQCKKCKHVMHFHEVSLIPACKECKGKNFIRISEK